MKVLNAGSWIYAGFLGRLVNTCKTLVEYKFKVHVKFWYNNKLLTLRNDKFNLVKILGFNKFHKSNELQIYQTKFEIDARKYSITLLRLHPMLGVHF